MRRSVVTALIPLALAGAPAGCWMPNPLFIETATAPIETSGSSFDASATSLVPDPTTTTTGEPEVTTAEATTQPPLTTASSTSTTTEALPETSTGTTGPDTFQCPEGAPCCEVDVVAAADAFFVDAEDAAAPPIEKCPFPAASGFTLCPFRNYGGSHDEIVYDDPNLYNGLIMFGMRFPVDDGALVAEGGPIEVAWISPDSARLVVHGMFDWGGFKAFKFSLRGFPRGMEWTEGGGKGQPCGEHGSSNACRKCTEDSKACAENEAWDLLAGEVLAEGLTFEKVDDPTRVEVPFDLGWVPFAAAGVLLEPTGSTASGGEEFDTLQHGAARLFAKESGDAKAPRLRFEVCPP